MTLLLGDLIEERARVKKEIDALNRALKEFREQQEVIDRKLISELEADGVKRTATEHYSVSISEDTVPQVDDWDSFYQYILQHEDFSLLHRRVSATAWKELAKLGNAVPGISARELKRINFRTLL